MITAVSTGTDGVVNKGGNFILKIRNLLASQPCLSAVIASGFVFVKQFLS